MFAPRLQEAVALAAVITDPATSLPLELTPHDASVDGGDDPMNPNRTFRVRLPEVPLAPSVPLKPCFADGLEALPPGWVLQLERSESEGGSFRSAGSLGPGQTNPLDVTTPEDVPVVVSRLQIVNSVSSRKHGEPIVVVFERPLPRIVRARRQSSCGPRAAIATV